ncbi:MAG: lipid-A-disaccharide synthase [Saprospiraceae bacterium]|nr:lipid-A-disaccharide synthase [Saprospiraceae bacterium]
MKYYVIAGEASGDLHGSNLLKALKIKDAEAEFRAWGGDLMEAAGGDLRKHYRDLAFMGFLEVVKNLRTILRNIEFCKQDVLDYQPDALILIDYPGFNLRIAKWAKLQGLKVIYYISPQLWAWHASRVHDIKKSVDKMLVILPFEEMFYQKYNYKVDFVGHPLLDVIEYYKPSVDFLQKNNLSDKPIIALLPGSRKQEISRMLEIMLSVVSDFTDYQFVIAGAPSQPKEFYDAILTKADAKNVSLVQNQTYNLLSYAQAALVTSGTATLETALFNVPEVVCYKGSAISYAIAKRLVGKRIKFIALVNLIVDRLLVKELIQNDLNTQNLQQELSAILNPEKAKEIKTGYAELRQRLGNIGASERAANTIISFLKSIA